MMSQLLGCEVHSLSLEGIELFKFLAEQDNVQCYDLKTAEKQTGLGVEKRIPFACDLGHPQVEGELSGESYSGIGPTSEMNELQICFTLLALKLLYKIDFPWLAIFSDNFATGVTLPKSNHYDEDERFCGFMPAAKHFGPVSLCTDNPKHRLAFNNEKQYQSQKWQYVMRPLLSVTMNGLVGWESCMKFLDFIIASEQYKEQKTAEDEWIGSWLNEYVLDPNGSYRELHPQIVELFPQELAFVKRWWVTQDNDATFVSDLQVGNSGASLKPVKNDEPHFGGH